MPRTCLAGSRHACHQLASQAPGTRASNLQPCTCWRVGYRVSLIWRMGQEGAAQTSSLCLPDQQPVPAADQQPVPAACAGSLLFQCSSLLFQCSSLLLQCSSLLFLMPVLAWCVLRDDRAKTPHDVPDGFYPIRRCQFLQVSFEYDRSFSTLEG